MISYIIQSITGPPATPTLNTPGWRSNRGLAFEQATFGKLGTVEKYFIYYFVKLDDEIPPTEGVRDNVLCLLPDEIEVVQ